MNEHTIKVLELAKILKMTEERAATETGARRVRELAPDSDLGILRHRLEQVRELRGVISSDGRIPFRQIYDVSGPLSTAALGSCMSIPDILRTGVTLKSVTGLRQFLAQRRDSCPVCCRLIEYENFDSLTELLDRSVAPDGTIPDSASATLAALRNETRSLDGRIKEKIGSFVQSPKYKAYLQEPIVTTRSDRYCIPVKAEYRSSVPGIVHDSSGSGSTLYIEPGVIVDLGNRLRDTQAREREEIQNILYAVSARLGEKADAINFAVDCASELDMIYAKALLAADYDCTEPKLNERGKINIRQARHLLLPRESAVPIDVTLGGRYNCLLITGPNTGGKTVTLKTVGSLVLMAMCGMFIPAAENSEVSVFTDIFADIGDEQSIEQSLSTFSGHMKNIVEITAKATGRSLVLLDELGAGTDPVEGAALAQSIIVSLLAKKARIIATSHYGELKQFAYSEDMVENASVEFDTNTLRPTYRLLTGVPGSSNALLIASRMGISSEIIDKARGYITRDMNASDELLQKLEDTHREAAAYRQEAADRLKELEELRKKQLAELDTLKRRQANIEDKVRKRANKIIAKYSDEIEFTLALLKETPSENKDRQEARKEINTLISDFKKEINTSRLPEAPKPPAEKLTDPQPGDAVRVTSLGQEGYIESVSGKNAVVSINNKKITVALSGLVRSKARQTAEPGYTAVMSSPAVRPEINLIGMRAEEALLQLEKYLDKAMLSNLDRLRIVHGKGTGALRQAVCSYLKNHSSVVSFAPGDPEEGGDGVTIAKIK
ncbi:MAG: endonuclease MutS2 [Abditibacteriota bacterium]|nr:endonuclease MutS2 [Abditibacteriota bacterium]